MQITQNQNAIRIWKNLELNIIYAGHAIVGQDWKEPKVCSPFSRIYYYIIPVFCAGVNPDDRRREIMG